MDNKHSSNNKLELTGSEHRCSTQDLVVISGSELNVPLCDLYRPGIAITLFTENLYKSYTFHRFCHADLFNPSIFPNGHSVLVRLYRVDPINQQLIQIPEDHGQDEIQSLSRIFRISLSRIICWISTSCHVSPDKSWGSGGSTSWNSWWPACFSKPRTHLEIDSLLKPNVAAALVMESCHCHSFSPRGLLHTGLVPAFFLPILSADLRKWTRFSRGVAYSKLHTALLALSPSLWLICVCSDVGGGPRKARTTSWWTLRRRGRPEMEESRE